MGRVLAELERLERTVRAKTPLACSATQPPARAAWCTGLSTYAASSVLQIERRTLPGESPAMVLGEIEAILESLRATDPLRRRARLLLPASYEGSAEAPSRAR